MKVQVSAPPGYKAVRIGYPTLGELFVFRGKVYNYKTSFPQLIVEPDGSIGTTFHKVPAAAPSGWAVVDYRVPHVGEHIWVDRNEVSQNHRDTMNMEHPIVCRTVVVLTDHFWCPVKIAVPKAGEIIRNSLMNYVQSKGTGNVAITIYEPNLDEPGGRFIQVPVCGVPEGYRPYAWRVPFPGETVLVGGDAFPAHKLPTCSLPYLILEKLYDCC